MFVSGGNQMEIKVADEVWIGLALLHKEHPEQKSFRANEIVDRVFEEHLYERLRPGVAIHVSLHCVANKRPNPGNYRMLYVLEDGTRRLFKKSDDFHPYREGGKMVPRKDDIPAKYWPLIDWWEDIYNKKR
jgi:hypothetical protein